VCVSVADPLMGKWEKWENGHFDRDNAGKVLRFVFSPILTDGIMGKAPKMIELSCLNITHCNHEIDNILQKQQWWKKMNTQEEIRKTMNELRDFLIQKNEQYGDSVMNPISIFSKLGKDAGLRVRIDDKLNRLMQGNDSMESDEDVVKDLIGYLTLLLIALRQGSGNTNGYGKGM